MPDHLGFSSYPDDEEFAVITTLSQLTDQVNRLNAALSDFWARWRDEYFTELRYAHQYVDRSCIPHSTVSVGDIVVVYDESLPRGFWKLGRVEKVRSGRDGRIRGATV